MTPESGVITYDPRKVIVLFGIESVSGVSNSNWLTIRRMEDPFILTRGIQGYDRKYIGTGAYEITLTLKRTSRSNAPLQALFTADVLANVGGLPFVVTDLTGGTIFASASAFICKDPEVTFSNGIGDLTWTFYALDGVLLNTGSLGRTD